MAWPAYAGIQKGQKRRQDQRRRQWWAKPRAECEGCQAKDEGADYEQWLTGKREGITTQERQRHMKHIEEDVREKTELGKRLMARLYGAMDSLTEISEEAKAAGDWENASQAQMYVAKVVEVAARVGGVVQAAGAVVNVEQRSPLAVNFDVRKLAESYQRTALEAPAGGSVVELEGEEEKGGEEGEGSGG